MTSKKELLQGFHENIGGEYDEGKLGHGPYLVFPYKNWAIVLDYHTVHAGNSNVTYTRVRTAYKAYSPLEMTVKKEGIGFKIGKAFGAKDIEIGDEIFDDAYVIKGSDEFVISRLLNFFEIKSRINFKTSFKLKITKKSTMGMKACDGESGIIFYKTGRLKHEIEIINLIELFKFILDELVELNVALEDKPLTEIRKKK
ncbi:MAG: hypothetical protein JXR88_03785 [Clostridia bacterium]|nr:hypothetical protein [Clostridia bacterium]